MKNTKQNRILMGPRTLRSEFSDMIRNDRLDDLIVSTIDEWYAAKHPKISADEVTMVNSLTVPCCPKCNAVNFVRDGKRKDGIRQYRCRSCGRKFNPLTGTLFDSHKIPVSEWIEFLIHMFQLQSMEMSALDNRNSYSTGRYWTKKLFLAIRDYQNDIRVHGIFWTDETYLKVMPKDMQKDKDGKLLRGLSRNNLCIMTATDGEHTVLIPAGMGKPSKQKITDNLLPHIGMDSAMIDDGEKSHAAIVEAMGIPRTIYPTKATKGLPNEKNPMDPINTVHRIFKRFMKAHGSYDRDDIQDWCNLFSFIWNHKGNMAEMIKDVLQMIISTHEKARFRDIMKKKP